MELELGCSLQVVHVPGIVMIGQGTDGLSRGVWATALHGLEDPSLLNAVVFAPLKPDPTLVQPVVDILGVGPWFYQPWEAVWDA